MAIHKITRQELSDDINIILDQMEINSKELEETLTKINEIKIPTKLSELKNDVGFITAEDISVTSKAPLESPNFTGKVSIDGKSNIAYKDDIPEMLSDLKNDKGFITREDESITNKAPINNPKFTGKVTVNNTLIATANMIPKNLSELINDKKYLTAKDFAITSKANKATSGYNTDIGVVNSYQFVVEGDNKHAAGITFDRGRYRVNFGIDTDNKLKIGGGLTNQTYELIDSNNILSTLFSKGLFLLSANEYGELIALNNNGSYSVIYNENKKSLELQLIEE